MSVNIESLAAYVDWEKQSLWLSIGSIFFNPLFWNTVARMEYRNKTLTKLACGDAYRGCYGLAITIFSLGIFRDHLYQLALQDQPKMEALGDDFVQIAAYVLFAIGSVLVVSSMWVLGVTGTYLGDYFGILMDDKVTGFPFNVTDDPMYWGSTMNFIATALWYQRPAGLVLSLIVYVVYKVALMFEGPFTGAIYAARDKKRQQQKSN